METYRQKCTALAPSRGPAGGLERCPPLPIRDAMIGPPFEQQHPRSVHKHRGARLIRHARPGPFT